MKIKTELDLTVQMGGISHIGTGCQGYLPEGIRYEDIVRVFGEPQLVVSPDNKIKSEWVGRINGFVFTIHDYKSPVEPQRNTEWYIGGKQKLVMLVNGYFKAL